FRMSEAIHAILVYSQNVEELLKRRKVYREIIFKYLAAQGIPMPPSSEKHLLIDRVKQYWSGQLTTHTSESGDRKPHTQVTTLLFQVSHFRDLAGNSPTSWTVRAL
uniref:Chromosome 3 open reading frame 38 n=1 Tax=Buteo japonicus TaxID=224669 RepID=A0A8B9Z3I4_9AVES